MKRLLIALLILPCILMAQPLTSTKNSTSALLGSGATFNGTIESVEKDYNYLIVVVKANKSSASNGLVVRWTNSNVNTTTYKAIDKRTYTANDTLNGTNVFKFPIHGAYYKVSYTNTSSAQTGTFSLVTYQIKETDALAGLFEYGKPGFVTNIAGFRDTTYTFTITNGTSLSDSVNLGNRRIKLIEMPGTWTTASLTFAVYASSAWNPLYDDASEIVFNATASTTIVVNPRNFIGISKIKLRSGTAASAVTQGGTRTIKIIAGNY